MKDPHFGVEPLSGSGNSPSLLAASDAIVSAASADSVNGILSDAIAAAGGGYICSRPVCLIDIYIYTHIHAGVVILRYYPDGPHGCLNT